MAYSVKHSRVFGIYDSNTLVEASTGKLSRGVSQVFVMRTHKCRSAKSYVQITFALQWLFLKLVCAGTVV